MNLHEEFFTVKERTEQTTVIERSKFICSLKSCESEEEIKDFIEEIKKNHSLATHNCYAYIADEKGLVQKFSDDGEPQGTAGMPMLELLRKKKLYKTVAVVTRYFGGIKLGTGGLVRAYQGAVSGCINKAKVLCQKYSCVCGFSTDYNGFSKILKYTESTNVKTLNIDYNDGVNIKVAVFWEYYDTFCKDIVNALSGKVDIRVIDWKYIPF